MYGLINGKIYTVSGENWDKNPVSAMAVNDDGTIAATGSNEEITALVGDGEIRDLTGNTVFPGMIDGHVHIPGTAFSELYQVPITGLSEREETLECIRKFVAEHPDDKEYFGQGYSPGIFMEGELPKKILDEITDKPVVFKDVSCHSRWLNSAAMKKYGIDENTTTESVGLIQKTPEGELTGIFNDVTDIGIPDEQEFTIEQQDTALKHFLKSMNALGYTSMMNVSPTWGTSFYRYMDLDRDELTARVTMSHFIHVDTPDEDLAELKKMSREFRECDKSDLLQMRTAKYMLDGVLEGHTAFLSEPYMPEIGKGDDYCGDSDWTDDELVKSVSDAIDAGFQIHFHTIGDAAVHMGLDALEKAGEGHDPEKMRNVLTHLQLVMPDDFERFRKLGVIAAIQPFWHDKEEGWHEVVEIPALGPERASHMYPAKAFIDHGVRITASADFPISYTDNPLDGIRAGVTRNIWNEEFFGYEIDDMDAPATLLWPEQRLSVKDMIEAYTINGAYEIFREDEVGSLEPGKKADYIILDTDIMNCDPLRINYSKLLETVFGGRTVYKAD